MERTVTSTLALCLVIQFVTFAIIMNPKTESTISSEDCKTLMWANEEKIEQVRQEMLAVMFTQAEVMRLNEQKGKERYDQEMKILVKLLNKLINLHNMRTNEDNKS